MWNCLTCFNESPDSAEYCAYCGSPKSRSLENAREIATKSSLSSSTSFVSSVRASHAFPVIVPVLLRLSETVIRVVAAIVGVVVGTSGSVAVYLLADPSGMTGRLFNLSEPAGAIPLFTLILFCWGLTICALRYLRTGAAKRLSADGFLLHAVDLAKVNGLDRLAVDLDLPTTEYSPLLRRLRALTKHWSIGPSLQDADILLQQQLYSDEERVRAGYSLCVRLFGPYQSLAYWELLPGLPLQ